MYSRALKLVEEPSELDSAFQRALKSGEPVRGIKTRLNGNRFSLSSCRVDAQTLSHYRHLCQTLNSWSYQPIAIAEMARITATAASSSCAAAP